MEHPWWLPLSDRAAAIHGSGDRRTNKQTNRQMDSIIARS